MTICESINGKRDQLVGKIQERYGIAKTEAERQLLEFERKAATLNAAVRRSRRRTNTIFIVVHLI